MPDTPGQEGAEGHSPTEIRVFRVGKSLKIEPFKIPESPLDVGWARKFKEWIEDFEDETSYFEITEIRGRVSALEIYGGKEIKKLARNLPETAPVFGDDDYQKLQRRIENYLNRKKKKNKYNGRFTFRKSCRRRVCCHVRGATVRKIKGLRIWRANRWQKSGTLDTNH